MNTETENKRNLIVFNKRTLGFEFTEMPNDDQSVVMTKTEVMVVLENSNQPLYETLLNLCKMSLQKADLREVFATKFTGLLRTATDLLAKDELLSAGKKSDAPVLQLRAESLQPVNQNLFKRIDDWNYPDEAGIRKRTINVLHGLGIKYTWELSLGSFDNLLRSRNFGKKCLNYLRKNLASELGDKWEMMFLELRLRLEKELSLPVISLDGMLLLQEMTYIESQIIYDSPLQLRHFLVSSEDWLHNTQWRKNNGINIRAELASPLREESKKLIACIAVVGELVRIHLNGKIRENS